MATRLSVIFPLCAKFFGGQVASPSAADPGLSNRGFDALGTISSAYGVLPKSYLLADVTLSGTVPYALGGSMEIWRGQQNGRQVCVKALRRGAFENLDEVKRVCGTSVFWRDCEIILILIRGFTMKSSGGSTFRIRTCCPSSGFRKRCNSRLALSVPGCRTETSSSTPRRIGRPIDSN